MDIIKINPIKPSGQVLLYAAGLIKKGKIVIFPTDTVYIPLADATNKKAVKRVFLLKRRSSGKAIPIFVKNIHMAKKLAKIDIETERFLKKVWPGRVTVVLKRKRGKMKLYGIERDTIAMRIPNYRPVNVLLNMLNRPLVGTSANISGQAPSGKLQKLLIQFEMKKHTPDLAVDAGNLYGRPSKVIDFTSSPPAILRA